MITYLQYKNKQNLYFKNPLQGICNDDGLGGLTTEGRGVGTTLELLEVRLSMSLDIRRSRSHVSLPSSMTVMSLMEGLRPWVGCGGGPGTVLVRRRGPEKQMIMAPVGADMMIHKTHTISTVSAQTRSGLSPLPICSTVSRATGANAACHRQTAVLSNSNQTLV